VNWADTGGGTPITTTSDRWRWIDGYDYPVLDWQTTAPDLSALD
jgi:hypothetical protein